MFGEDSSDIVTRVNTLSYSSGRLDNNSSSNKIITQNSSVNVKTRARLHLIVQIPVLKISNEPENSKVVLRQKEYMYCLRRNLNSPHVSWPCIGIPSFKIVTHKIRVINFLPNLDSVIYADCSIAISSSEQLEDCWISSTLYFIWFYTASFYVMVIYPTKTFTFISEVLVSLEANPHRPWSTL